MRTIIENKEGLEREYSSITKGYNICNFERIDSKSCFYEFGEEQEMQFVYAPSKKSSGFIKSLKDRI